MPLSEGSKTMKRFVLTVLALTISTLTLSSCESMGTKEKIGATIGVITGGVVANKWGDKDNKGISTALGVAAGYFIGSSIGKYLDERDKQHMAQSTHQAISTGKTQTWTNPETKTSGEARVVETKKEPKPVVVPVLKSKVKQIPPLDIIGDTYRAKSISNVRGGPGADYVKTGSLKAGETVNVVGKVKTGDWYLISQDGVGSGFVSSPLMEHVPGEIPPSSGTTIAQSDIAQQQVASERVCRTIEQSVSLPDGSQKSETIEACQGGDGWKVKS
ncbi:SH3 domain-containing protein [Pseudomonas japonica]|nr:SH3 domain-containing protein [Pseudomonas japonica]